MTASRFRTAPIPGAIFLLVLLLGSWRNAAAPVPVLFPEGSIHGFLILRTPEGGFLAHGDIIEAVRGGEIHKTTVFRFKDGSLFEETVVFSQKEVYLLLNYNLEQRGPAFSEDVMISLDRATGKYRVETKSRKGRAAVDVIEGTLDLPPDVYNGMIPTILRDLKKGSEETVHFVAFTPEPRIIQLEITPAGKQKMKLGEEQVTAVHYVLKPKLGAWLKIFSALLGRSPKDAHAWILEGEIPAFVGFEGQLYTTDPVWRIDLVSPERS